MNSKKPNTPWRRLAASARSINDDRDTAAPYGFASRVAALAMAQERRVVSLFERFAFRALAAAGALALLSIVANYSMFGTGISVVDDELAEDDPVAVLLDT